MRETIYNDIKYIIGQNANENWNILENACKINDNYIWFHLNSFPSCFVIMYSSIDDLCDSSLNDYLTYGATLCKQNTKYRNLADLKICYTQLKKLKKTNKIGEIIISGKRNIIKL
tara:strand:+ start:70 stop:414 length:345 start_codon:yes stop_codon:yes gene_type:complete